MADSDNPQLTLQLDLFGPPTWPFSLAAGGQSAELEGEMAQVGCPRRQNSPSAGLRHFGSGVGTRRSRHRGRSVAAPRPVAGRGLALLAALAPVVIATVTAAAATVVSVTSVVVIIVVVINGRDRCRRRCDSGRAWRRY
jgi:hypothetical protein